MEYYGEFTPQVKSWVEDRLGVSRIVIELDWVGERPSGVIAPPIAIPMVRKETTSEDGGSHGTVTYYFEGLEGEPSEQVVYDLEPSFEQKPISGHSKIGELMKKYGGFLEDGEIVWPEKAPKGTKGARGLSATTGKTDNSMNAMYGVNTFNSFGAVWSETRVHKIAQIPPSILLKVGTLQRPPGPVPDLPNREWLEAGPAGTLRGNVLQIKRRWILSGYGGWLPDVYDGSDIAGGV